MFATYVLEAEGRDRAGVPVVVGANANNHGGVERDGEQDRVQRSTAFIYSVAHHIEG